MSFHRQSNNAWASIRSPFFTFLTCFCLMCAAAVSGEREVKFVSGEDHLVPANYAEIEISGAIPERLPEIYVIRPAIDTVEDLVRRFNMAAEDRAIRGVVVRLGRFGGGWAKAYEIRSAIRVVAAQGKETTVYLEQGGNLQYYIASAADRIVMPPAGSLMLLGLRGEVLFLRGLFDKVGITPDFIQFGDYKGASDPFMHTSPTEEFEEAFNSLFDSLFDKLVGAAADGRAIERDTVKKLIDAGPYTARDAMKNGLVDAVMSYDDLLSDMGKRSEAPFNLVSGYGKEEATAIPLGEGTQRLLKMLLGMRTEPDLEPAIPEGNVIAILYAIGPIIMNRSDSAWMDDSVVDARLMVRVLDGLKKEPNVKAVVMRVDSPGGDAQASEMVWQAVRRTNRVKPVISSISDMAGSGGYYIACAGRYIYAGEGSLTGSIGVMGGKFVIKDLLDKLGLNVEVFQRGEHAGLFSSVETFSERQRERFSYLLEDTYDLFVARVAESRGMSREEVEAVAAGRPFTGAQALKKNLVDEAGGLQDAVEYARRAAGLDPEDEIKLVVLPKSQSLLDAIFWGRDIGVSSPTRWLNQSGLNMLLPNAAADALQYLHAVSLLSDYQPAALMPVMIRIE